MIDRNSFPPLRANGTRQVAREQYLKFLREQKTEYDYDAIFENTKNDLIVEDGADEGTAKAVAMECVGRLKSSVDSIKATRTLLERLVNEPSKSAVR
jgi:hypothetical protein